MEELCIGDLIYIIKITNRTISDIIAKVILVSNNFMEVLHYNDDKILFKRDGYIVLNKTCRQ